jgi:site-specific DNA-methyltransferase (adenine-specific)
MDCLEGMKQIPDGTIDAVICDLPYGTTACAWDSVIPFDKLWEQYHRICKPNAPIVLFGSEPFSTMLRMSNLKEFKYDWIWDKEASGSGLLANIQPLKVHEIISVFHSTFFNPQMSKGVMRNKKSYGSKSGSTTGFIKESKDNYNDLYYPKSIIDVSNASQKDKLHPTQKPVDLLRYLVLTYTNEGDTVLDNCMGSGTTAIACIKERRHFIGFELNKEYYDKACKRIKAEQAQLTLF